METINEAWAGILSYLHQLADISEVGFKTWLECIEPKNIDGNELVLYVQTQFQKKMVGEHYASRITEACEHVLGIPLEVCIFAGDELVDPGDTEEIERRILREQPISEFGETGDEYLYSFDNFIVGPANRYAHAAAQAVANNPASNNHNPLFIYGGSGLGKTHLLYAICNELRRTRPHMRILYTKGELLINDLIDAIGSKSTAEFHAKYRQVDILLVDDIQFIAGKIGLQEEFFHTFDELYRSGKQIVLVSDRPPNEIATLDERLRSRFVSGVTADIQPPDYETRVAIVKRKANLLNFHINDNICEYLADQLKSNVRQLEGAVKTLRAQCLLLNEEPTLFYAQNAIRDIRNSNQAAPITVDNIIEEVARTMNVTVDDIRSQRRPQPIMKARRTAIYVVREITGLSMEDIGSHFGGRDHTTILYQLREAEKFMASDSLYKGLVNDIIKNIRSK